MGQTIVCEYLAKWESTGIEPDPTAFGFDGLYAMLVECQDAMLKLGTAANDGRRKAAELEKIVGESRGKWAERAVLAEARIVELEAQVYNLGLDHSRCREDAIWQSIADDKRIADLKRMLSDAGAVLEEYSGLIDEKGKRVAELFNQTVSQAKVIADLQSQLAAAKAGNTIVPLIDVAEQRATLTELIDNADVKRRMQVAA